MADIDEGMIEPPTVVQTAQTTERGIHSIFLVNSEHKLAESVAHHLAERYGIPYVHINSILESMSGSTNFSKTFSEGMDEYADTGVLLHGFPVTGEHIAACTNFPKAKIVALQFVSNEPRQEHNDEHFLHATMQIKARIDPEKYACIEYDESKDVLTNLETLGPLIGSSKAEEIAAIKIQAIRRGEEVRKQKAQRASSATKIQAGVRGRQIRKREAEKKAFLEAQKVDIFFSKIVSVATDPRTAKSVTSIFSKNNSLKMDVAKKKWMALDSAKKPELHEFQQLLADEMQWKQFQALFQSKNGQGELLIDLLAFKNVVEDHGGVLKNERDTNRQILKNRLFIKEFMTRKDEIKEIFDQYSNENGVLTMQEFKSVLKKRTELWGYSTEKHIDGLHQAAILDEIDNIHKEEMTWKQFHSFMDKVAHGDSREVADKIVERAAIADTRKRKLAATKKTVEKNVRKDEEIAPVPRKVFQRGVPRDEDVEENQMEASSRKEMLIFTLQKYRRGLNRLFQFYSKANMGDFNGRLFEKIAEEHSGVSLIMFRTMCKDLGLVIGKETMNIITAARKRHARSSLTNDQMPYEDIVSDTRPYTDMKRIEKCFLKKSTLLSGVSGVSHGKGILTLSQFVSAFANVAVDMLDVFPWNERYVEEWRKVDAVFSRLDLNNPSQLNNRIRGRGGFGVGDGDLKGHDGSLPNMQKHCFSFPLNLPGDPGTPEPPIPENVKPVRRCRKPGSGITGGKISSSGRIVPRKSTRKTNDSRMIVSLASEFGIDDTVINFGNPYGTSTGNVGALSSMLSDLNLTYGVDEDRLHLEDQHKGRRTYEAALTARKHENGRTFFSPKIEHDHAWTMTWDDLETNQYDREKPKNETFNAIARQRRSELERPNVGYRARNGGYGGARNMNVRASPRKAYEQGVRREYGDVAPIEPPLSHARNFNRDQKSYVPKRPKTLAKRPSLRIAVNTDVGKRNSARTPGRHVSKSEFNSSRKQNKPKRRNRQAGQVAYGGRPSPSSPSRR